MKEHAKGAFVIGASLLSMAMILNGCAYTPRYTAAETPWIGSPQETAAVDPAMEQLLRQSPRAFMVEARRRYDENVTGYQCRMVRIERLKGELAPKQVIHVAYLREPHSVYMEWLENPAGAERVLYVAGKHDGQMLVLPVLVGWLTGPVKVDPDGEQALQHTRKPITEFGFGRALERLLRAYETGEVSQGHPFQDHYVGIVAVDGRCAYMIERVITEPVESSDGVRGWRVSFDCDTLLPIAVTEFGADQEVLGDYLFTDVELNPGLAPSDFTEQRLRSQGKGKD